MNKAKKVEFLATKLKGLGMTKLVPKLESKNEEYIDFIYDIISDKRFDTIAKDFQKDRLKELMGCNNPKEAIASALAGSLSQAINDFVKDNMRSIDIDIKNAEKQFKRIRKDSFTNKMSYLMECGNKLGAYKENPGDLFTLLDDIYRKDDEYFDNIVGVMEDLMDDDHYKTCDCVLKKFLILVQSSSKAEASKKVRQEFH